VVVTYYKSHDLCTWPKFISHQEENPKMPSLAHSQTKDENDTSPPTVEEYLALPQSIIIA
jgi:hypothetical protein